MADSAQMMSGSVEQTTAFVRAAIRNAFGEGRDGPSVAHKEDGEAYISFCGTATKEEGQAVRQTSRSPYEAAIVFTEAFSRHVDSNMLPGQHIVWRTRPTYCEEAGRGYFRARFAFEGVGMTDTIERAKAIAVSLTLRILDPLDLPNHTYRIGPFDPADPELASKIEGELRKFRDDYADFVMIEAPELVQVAEDETGKEIAIRIIVAGRKD